MKTGAFIKKLKCELHPLFSRLSQFHPNMNGRDYNIIPRPEHLPLVYEHSSAEYYILTIMHQLSAAMKYCP